MNCKVDVINVTVIRGDFFPLTVQLPKTWVEVIENPTLYRCRLVFRDEQDDLLVNRLSVVATPEGIPDAIGNEPRVNISFGIAGSVTQTLPDYDIVGFCEIYEAVTPSNPTRLFNMKVCIRD